MAEKPKNERKAWNLALAVHLFIYLLMWIFALYELTMLPATSFGAEYTHFIAAVMLWLLVLALHVIAHLASGRQGQSLEAERKAYREGFADAMQRLSQHGEVVERLMQDEDEYVELLEKPKRRLS